MLHNPLLAKSRIEYFTKEFPEEQHRSLEESEDSGVVATTLLHCTPPEGYSLKNDPWTSLKSLPFEKCVTIQLCILVLQYFFLRHVVVE